MKKSTLLLLLSLSFCALSVRSQLNFNLMNPFICNYGGTSSATANVTSTLVGTTSYTWSIASSNCAGTIIWVAPNGMTAYFGLPCAANYTITCTAYNGATPIGNVTQTTVLNPLPVITTTVLASASPACAGTTFTIVPSGAVTYTINGPGFVVTPMVTTCYTISGTNTFGCVSNTAVCLTVQPNPTIAVIGLNSVCAGGTATLSAAGATTYTWNPGSVTGANIVVSPAVNTCYTVTGANAAGCTSSAIKCLTVNPNPPLTIIGSNTLCQGSSSTYTATGAATYTWNIGSTFPVISILPLTSTCYSVAGTSAQGCTNMASTCMTVTPSPTLVVSGNGTVCAGSSLTLSLMGALSYTMVPPGQVISGSTVIITPTAGIISYTLDGCGLSCCAQPIVFGSTVVPVPSISISGNNTVCLGSSVNFTASGANTYTWNTAPAINTSTLSAIPTASVNYMVYGTGANGCIGFNSMPIVPNALCADVWPGDANSDGVVSNTDVFEIGLAFNNTGASRTGASNAYTSQYASAWSGLGSTGKNKCHVDCNGDGTISNADTIAIYNNFSLSHPFKISDNNSANSDISLVAPNTVYAGQWNKADVMLGSAASPMSQIYGVAFDLNIDQSMLENNSAYLVYTASFLNAGNQNVQFRKNNVANGKIYAASVRVDAANVSGNGKIAELWFKVSPTAANNAVLNLSVSNSVKIGNTGTSAVLSSGSASTSVSTSPVQLNENSLFERSLSFYPNPATQQLNLHNDLNALINFSITDILGREIIKGEFNQSKTLDVSNLASGAYFIKFESAKQSTFKKLVIE